MAIRRTGSQTLVNRGVTAAAATPVNIVTGTGGPTVNISSIQIANSTFVAKDDLAIDTAGGYMIINGSGFKSGAVAYIQGTAATSTSFVSASRLNVTVPALSSGLLDVYVVNTDGSGSIYLQSLRANGVPSWTTTSPLTSQDTDSSFAINLVATGAAGDGTITYAVSAGSTLPSGTFLASNGYFYGTISGLTEETTYSFSVDAIDAQNQETARSFNITVRAGDQYLKNTVLLLNAETTNNTWITDISTNAAAITITGDTRPSAFNPYQVNWSNYFDGNGDYIDPTNNAALYIGNSDGTIEFWINPSGSGFVWNINDSDGSGSYWLAEGVYYDATNKYLYMNTNITNASATNYTLTSTVNSVPLNTWTHFAFTKVGTTWNIYINGVLNATGSKSHLTTTVDGSTARIGARGFLGYPEYFTGYVSNFRLVKGNAVYTSSFTPSTTSLTAIANTSLLTCQSSDFVDKSNNAFTITKAGNVTASNFGPFIETDVTSGSGYFDGTGDYLSVTDNSAYGYGTGDFTIEFWMYPNSTALQTVISNLTSVSSTNPHLYINGSIRYYTAGGDRIVGSNLNAGQWYHIALCRNSGSTRLFVNGVQSGSTYSDSNNYGSSAPLGIATYWNSGSLVGSNIFSGYFSNLRILKGTGLYTTTFTPPTTPLTEVANTSLLTLQSRIGENNSRFVDSSSISNLITRNGNATQGTFSPFQRGGWSNYFDTSGDSLTVPYSSLLALGTGDCTIESWVLISSWPQQFNNVLDVRESASGPTSYLNNAISFGFENNGKFVFYAGSYSASTAVVETASAKIALNTWYHVAMTRSSGTTRLYINGVQEATSSNSWNQTSGTATTLYIGNALAGRQFNGYISNLRILKGTALYTSNFTPPTLPLTAVANTSILTCADNGFVDDSVNNFTITRNGDVSVQPFSPFKVHTITANTHSVYFDGTGDYLSIPDSQTFMNVGTNDLTIEGWVYFNSVGTGTFFGTADSNGNSSGGVVIYLSASGTLRVYGPSVSGTITTSAVTGTWYHIAVTRQTNTWTLWLNGTSQGTFTDSGSLNPGSSRPLAIGRIGAYDGFYLTGYVSNVRFINGTALYTSSFTVPTSPLTSTANTKLLTCASNTIVDLSTANTGNTAFAITVNGNSKATTVNPLGFTVTSVNGPSAEYSIINEGGSMYFDGTGDFLTTNYSVNWSTFGTYTLEFWVYHTSMAPVNQAYASTGGTGYTNFYNYANGRIGLGIQGTNEIVSSAGVITANQWQHVVYTYDGTTTRIYVNGVQVASGTTAVYPNNSANLVIGSGLGGLPVYGYMSNLRLIKGRVLYTSGFVPPAAPQLPIVGTTLLVNGTNGSIIDYTRKNNLETVGDVKIRNNIKKFGNTSMFFDGTGDYLNTPPTSITDLNGDFTIEAWIYRSITTTHSIVNIGDYINASGILFYVTNGNALAIYTNNSLAMSGGTVPATTWTHVALVRSGTGSGNLKLYLNGTNVGTPVTNNTTFSGRLYVGIDLYNGSLATNFMNGYIDDLRVTKGVARYTSNFSVPSSQFLTS